MSIYSAKDIGLDLPVAAQGNEAGQGLYGANDIGLAHLEGPTSSTSKRGFGSSLVKSVARIGESVANLVEGDPLKVDRADAGLFSSGETDWQMDDMGNLTGFDTRPAEEIRKDNYGLVSRAAGAVRKSLHDVKGGEYEKGSAAEVAGAVIENAPHSLIYMLPHFMPGGGNISNAIMYQDTYLSRLKELRDLRAQGKIEATDQDIENNASKYGFAEMMPEAVGNASEAAIIKGVSRIVPGLSAFPKAMEFISKIKGPKTGSALIAELFPSTARKAGRVVTAGVASAPIEGLTEYITETGLGSMEGQAPLDLSIGSATIPGGMSREDYIAERGKFAATVGALSGAAISGTMSAVSQVNQSNSRDAFVSDIVSPIAAVNPESDETKVAAGKRFSAISDLITIIGQSGISEEEKTNAAVNLLQAFDRNEKVDLQNIFVEPSDLAEVEDVGETSVGEELRTGESVIEAETQAKVDRAVEGLKAINIEEESAIQEPIELTEQDIIKEPQRDYKAEFDAFSQREITDTQVTTSTRVDTGFAKILKGVHDRIGTKANIALFSTIDFAGEEGSAFREYLETQGHSVLDIRGGRVFQSERDGKKFYTIVANTDTRLQARSAIFMHEALGHITMMEHFDLAPPELQRALLKEFAQWKKFDRTPEGFLSFDSFNEDFGDPKTLLWSSLIGRPGESRQQVNRRSFHEFMAHQLSSKMQQRPEVQGIIQRYWASLKAKINKMYEAFKAQFLDIATNVNSVDEFIDFLFKTGNYAEVRQDNVENLNSILEAPAQVDEKTRLIQAVFDSMFEVVGGKRVLKSAWRFKKVFKDGNRSLVSRKDIESSGIYYKEEKGKTVVYKNKDVLFTIPWDVSRNLSAQSARMIATNLRDLYILATLQPSHVERAKANSTKMLNTSTGKKVTVKMGDRAARTLEIMWERAATLAQEQGITERQAFLMIMSGEGSAFSSLRPGVAGTEATGSLRKNMDRWIAMHADDLSSALQEAPTSEPVSVEEELKKEHTDEVKQTALSAEVSQTIDQVREIIETWWNKPKPSERVQDFEGLTQKVIFYFDLNGKDYTEVKPEIRNLIGATIKDVMQEKTGVEVQSEIKNKSVQRDKVLQMYKAGIDTTLAEVELRSFELFGGYARVLSALGKSKILGSYYDRVDKFRKAYFSDADAEWIIDEEGLWAPGSGKLPQSWEERASAGTLILADIIKHDDLFKVYPELQGLQVKFFNDAKSDKLGKSSYAEGYILLNYGKEPTDVYRTLFHELQHQVQGIEDFAGGSSPEQMEALKKFRKDAFEEAGDFLRVGKKLQKQLRRHSLGHVSDNAQKILSSGDFQIAEGIIGRFKNADPAEVIKGLEAELGSAEDSYNRMKDYKAEELYFNTAGEDEARRAGRMALKADERNIRFLHMKGKSAFTDLDDDAKLVRTDARSGQVYFSGVSTVEDTSQDELTFASYAMLNSFDLKISPKRRGQRKETTTGPYAGIIKQARKASKPRKPSVVDPLKLEKKRSALFSFLEKMDVIRERGEQLGLSTSEVMLKLGFAPDQVRKHIARYNRHKSKFSQNETIIRLAEIAGLINEETGRENLESLIKTMFPPTEFEEVQLDGTVKKVTDPGSDGSLQSLSTIARDMLINKLQTIIASSTGSKFDIENERSLGESIEEYKQEWASTGRLKKLGGFLKYVQSSAADFLESTKSGKELSFKLRRYLLTKTVMQRNYLVELNDFARKYSSAEERQKFYEVISGEREAATEDEKKFANLIKSINRTYGTEMQTLQVRVYKKDGSFTFFRYNQDMSDSYFPHMWKAEWFRNPTQDMIQSLLDSGEAQDRAHAKRIIQDFHKQTIRDRKFANVERARETELGGWITDPIEVYQKYVLGASARLASLREFGSTPEVVLAQLAIRHLKESRDPEALSKARDLINRVLGTKIEDQLLKEPKAAMSFGVMYSVGLLLQHSMLVQPGVMANMGALGGYKNLVKGIAAVLPSLWGNRSGVMNKRWAELAGVLAFTVNRELNDIVMDDETRLKSDKILRSFGITQVDAAMRIVGAIVGKLYATDVAMKYAATRDARSAQRLRRLGIDPRKITKDYLQSQEWYTKDLRMAALAFTEDTNFVLDPMRMPSIIQGHPLARILFLFKNFAFQQHRFLLRLLREDKGKAFKSLVGSLSGGALIMLVRMLLQGDDPEKILEKDGIAKTVWRAFMAGGGAGLFAEAIGSAVIPGSGPQTGMALDSPVFGLLETLGRGGKSLYNLAEGDATDQDMHNLYRSAIMTLQGGALAMPAQVGVPLNAAIGFTRPVAERAIAPSDRQRKTSYLQ